MLNPARANLPIGNGDNFKLSVPDKMESQSSSHYPHLIHNLLGVFPIRCARRITAGSSAHTKSTSSCVESRPSEKRTSELAASCRPVAKITWLGSSDPAEHAEPLEAQMPSMSNPAIKAMPSDPFTTKATVLARQ
jgi:hypothetical protein